MQQKMHKDGMLMDICINENAYISGVARFLKIP